MQLSPNFSLAEMTRSSTAARMGIPNIPSKVTIEILRTTCNRMEKVRSIMGVPILVSSGYRAPAVNNAVGGSSTSDHPKGLAVDFTAKGFTIRETIEKLRATDLEFDQLIDEFNSWVHIGFGGRMRRQVVSARSVSGKTRYISI